MQAKTNRSKYFLLACAVAAMAAAAAIASNARQAEAAQARGLALFRGDLPLKGQLAGHGLALPPAATRCTNCHENRVAVSTELARLGLGASAPATFAHPLNREWLASPQARRGGPPVAYDAKSLCHVLRAGIDPAHVVVPTTMPRYEVSDRQCRDLWAHLTSS